MSRLQTVCAQLFEVVKLSRCYQKFQPLWRVGLTIFLLILQALRSIRNEFYYKSFLARLLQLIGAGFQAIQRSLETINFAEPKDEQACHRLESDIKIRAIQIFLIIIICLMPVLRNWSLLVIPLILLFLWKSQTQWDSVDRYFTCFLLTLVTATFFSRHWQTGINHLATLVQWIIIAWLASRSIPALMIAKIIKASVYSSVLWLIIGFWQLCMGVPTPTGWVEPGQASLIPIRISSVFFNPNIYSIYLLGIIISVYFLFLETKLKIEKLILSIIGIGSLIGLYFTYSRTGWFIVLLSAVLIGWRHLKQLHWLRLVLLSLLVVAFLGSQVRIKALINLEESTFGYRLKIWRGVANILKDYWFWGGGPGSFELLYPYYRLKNIIADHAHQTYLQLWLEYGIVNIMLFLAFIVKVVKIAFINLSIKGASNKDNYHQITLVWIVILFLLAGFSETWYVNNYLGGYFWLNLGLLSALLRGSCFNE